MADAAVSATPTGVFTSCATPATSEPSAASFSCSTRLAWAARKASVRRDTFSSSRCSRSWCCSSAAARAVKIDSSDSANRRLLSSIGLVSMADRMPSVLPSVSTIGMPT